MQQQMQANKTIFMFLPYLKLSCDVLGVQNLSRKARGGAQVGQVGTVRMMNLNWMTTLLSWDGVSKELKFYLIVFRILVLHSMFKCKNTVDYIESNK